MNAEHVLSAFLLGGGIRSEPGAEEKGPVHQGVSVIVCTYKRAASLERFLRSFVRQECRVERLIIVDASPDELTERMLADVAGRSESWDRLYYFRVSGPLRGLTRQRNFGLRWVATDLVAFFDDDIVLEPGCLGAMERVHRRDGDNVAGVAAYMEGSGRAPDLLWRLRRTLGIVSTLSPGSYQRSGMSVPWAFLKPSATAVEGDYLPGGATMWRSPVVRELGFNESFAGYGQGEDLEFSLRARRKGKLMIAGEARLRHLHDESGRPDYFKLGYMAIYNRYQIHRAGLENRTAIDVAWFVYAWTLDTLMLARQMVFPSRIAPTLAQCAGRFKAAIALLRGK